MHTTLSPLITKVTVILMAYTVHCLYSALFLAVLIVQGSCSPFGPPFPITAAWFSPRTSASGWDESLSTFSAIGGDTILTKASRVQVTTREAFRRNPDWSGCVSAQTPRDPHSCFDEALADLAKYGLDVFSVLTYDNEEEYGNITRCPLDKKMTSSETYHRIILPGPDSGDPCKDTLPAGSKVVVLFTRYKGPDSNSLMLRSAAKHNMTVYLGLPGFPMDASGPLLPLLPAHASWTQRVLDDYVRRFNHTYVRKHTHFNHPYRRLSKDLALYDVIKGFHVSDECSLPNVTKGNCIAIYNAARKLVTAKSKSFALSASVDSRKSSNGTLAANRDGFHRIVHDVSPDVVIIHEGRGHGMGCYYWPTQEDLQIWGDDDDLFRIIERKNPNVSRDIAYNQYFTASNQEIYQALKDFQDNATRSGQAFDMWLAVEAFEELTENPCKSDLPGAPGDVNRAAFDRIQQGIAVGSAMVQKVAAVAWDPYFTCEPKSYFQTLAGEIKDNLNIPMIAKCFMHSRANKSVVLIGFEMEGETQAFSVDWPQTDGKRHSNDRVYGYYFEIDYGGEHHLVPSLEYTQLYDPYNAYDLPPKGYVKVSAGSQLCIYTYDFS